MKLFSLFLLFTYPHPLHSIDYSLPDITVPYVLNGRTAILEAYKSTHNHHWVSIGRPYLVKDSKNSNSSYTLTSESIHTQIRMLDSFQKLAILEALRLKYPSLTIHENDLGLIPLQKFTCKTEFIENEKRWIITGLARDFGMLDINMELLGTEHGSLLRKSFLSRIESKNDLLWTCHIAAGGKESTTTLRISWTKIQKEIFGDNTQVYISKQQLNRLAQRIRQELEIDEKYDYEADEFETDFKEKLILLTGTNFQQIDIDKAIGKLSKFEWSNTAKSLTSDQILNDWTNLIVIKISDDGDQEYIDLGNIDDRSNLVSIRQSTGIATSIFLVSNLKSRYSTSSTPIDHQIRELNWLCRDGFQWGRDGNRLIPISLKLLKLNLEDLQPDIILSGVKLRLKDTKFSKTIQLGGDFFIHDQISELEHPDFDALKQDLAILKQEFSADFAALKQEISADFNILKQEYIEDLAIVKQEFNEELQKIKADLLQEHQATHRAIKTLQKQLAKEREDVKHLRRQLSSNPILTSNPNQDEAITTFKTDQHTPQLLDTPHMYFPMPIDYTLDCKEFTNLDDQDYSWSSIEPQRGLHFGLKHVHCGRDYWFLHGIYWTEGFRVQGSDNWHLHAEFRCCRLIFNVTASTHRK